MRMTILTAVALAFLALPGAASAQRNTAVGVGTGAVAGAAVGGPVGAVVGGVVGGTVGASTEPRRRYYSRPAYQRRVSRHNKAQRGYAYRQQRRYR